MFLKLAALILALGLCACVLLATRQLRIEAANELANARLRLMQRDNELWRIRAEIAERVTPARVREMAEQIGGLQPIIAGLYPEPDAPAPGGPP